jgi:hypothetical protein
MQQVMRTDSALGPHALSAVNLAPPEQSPEIVHNLDPYLLSELADQQTAKLYGILDDLLQYFAVRFDLLHSANSALERQEILVAHVRKWQ